MRPDFRDIVHALVGAVVLAGLFAAAGCRHTVVGDEAATEASSAERAVPAPPAPKPTTLSECTCDQGEAPLVFREHARKAAQIWFLPDRRDEWCGLVGIAGAESNWTPDAVSHVGAEGMYQVMRGTWIELIYLMGLEGSPFDPWIAAQVAARYLARSDAFWVTPRTEMGSWSVEVPGYNAGDGNVHKGQTLAGGALYWAEIKLVMHQVTGRHADETIAYVARWHRITSRQCGFELSSEEF